MELGHKYRINIFESFLSKEECLKYLNIVPDVPYGTFEWKERTVDITNDPIVKKTQLFLKDKLNLDLKIIQAQGQNWNMGTYSNLHIHRNERPKSPYTSSLYLNDNFDGGEFYTPENIIKPKQGSLTFFNGHTVLHGVKQVYNNDRKTLIFWWGKNDNRKITNN